MVGKEKKEERVEQFKKEEDKMCRFIGDREEKVFYRGVYRLRLGLGEVSRIEDGEFYGVWSDYVVGQLFWKVVWE